MKNDFDYKLAYKLEDEYRGKNDILGLLQISLEFWENLGSLHTMEQRFPRLCYYFGRLKDHIGLKDFFESKSSDFALFPDSGIIKLGQKLFEIGYKYPNLNESELSELESLYCNPKYYELIDELLFDKEKLYHPLKSYTSGKVESKQSEDVIKEVKEAYLKNLYLTDYDNLMWFYNRTLNKVEQLDFDNSAEGIHYPIIDFLNYSVLLDYSKEIIGNEFHDFYYNQIFTENMEVDKLPYYRFTDSSLDEFKKNLKEFNAEKTDLLDEILEKCSLNWLNEFD